VSFTYLTSSPILQNMSNFPAIRNRVKHHLVDDLLEGFRTIDSFEDPDLQQVVGTIDLLRYIPRTVLDNDTLRDQLCRKVLRGMLNEGLRKMGIRRADWRHWTLAVCHVDEGQYLIVLPYDDEQSEANSVPV